MTDKAQLTSPHPLPSSSDQAHPIHFLLVEDQNMFRGAIKTELSLSYPNAEFTEVRTLSELKGITSTRPFTIAIVDLELPDGTTLDWITQISDTPEPAPVLILSSVDPRHEAVLFRAARAGVAGFVHKNEDLSVLRSGIASILTGAMFYSPAINQMRRAHSRPDFFNKILTEREQLMLGHIGEGLSNEEIAQKMAIKHSSVVEYRKRIMAKLDLHSATELMKYAIEKGFTKLA